MRVATMFVIGAILLTGCNAPEKKDLRPNILLIVVDDLGYSDLGCYGGEIRTPNIDLIAKKGIRFSGFHTSPMCAPTRAMLLSGTNNHVAGMGWQGGLQPNSPLYGQPGYEGHLSDRIIPFPTILRDAGYHTYTVGKWHLGNREEDSPLNKGFERSYNLLQGGANHFNNIGIEESDTLSTYREDGKLVEYPEGKYSTELYTDKLIEYISAGIEKNPNEPFFAYAAYTSPHWPLQVPDDYLDRYEGDYDIGYDSLRVLRFASLKEAGIISEDAKLPPRLDFVKPWVKLSDEEKKVEARKMELYAAMVDNLDFHVGRLIQFLKIGGLYENTIIIFMSDNGAAGVDFTNDFIRSRYVDNYENMGRANSFVSYGAPWAHAGMAPFNRYKRYTTEGGICVPFIISGPGIQATDEPVHIFLSVMDLAPTFYDLAKMEYPGRLGTKKTRPLLGNSILPFLKNKTQFIHDNDYGMGLEHRGRTFYRKGDWKIVNLESPYNEDKLMLFNIANDLGETTDLRNSNPEKFKELLTEWNDFVRANEIIIER